MNKKYAAFSTLFIPFTVKKKQGNWHILFHAYFIFNKYVKFDEQVKQCDRVNEKKVVYNLFMLPNASKPSYVLHEYVKILFGV